MTTTSTPIKFALVSAPSDPLNPASPEIWCVVARCDAAWNPIEITPRCIDIDAAIAAFTEAVSLVEHRHVVRRVTAIESARSVASLIDPGFEARLAVLEEAERSRSQAEATTAATAIWSPDDAVKRTRAIEGHVRELADTLAAINVRGWRTRIAATAAKIRDRVGMLDA